MIYHLCLMLREVVPVVNVFTYHTVRAGMAAFTAFVVALLIGPAIIRGLQRLKIGQYIRREHVADLHALHQGKAGTPTMGGVLIILSAVAALLLWADLTSRLLWVAMATLVFLGAVGFLDDFIKLRRRKNEGLSARAKMFGQIAAGVGLGMYVYLAPVTPGATQLNTDDVTEWPQFVAQLTGAVDGESEAVADARERLRRRLMLLPAWPEMAPQPGEPLSASDRVAVVENLNQLLSGGPFLSDELASAVKPSPEAMRLLEQGQANLSPRERYRLNRLLVEALFRETIAPSVANLHTHVEVPGFRFLLIPMGLLYILFVAVIIVGSSNAVNLTDGLDGLAIGASIMSLLAYTAIAYTVSRADWSRYLFLIYVPEASELTVFGAALLGTGLGFLWFNSHPAEVFMGDTGSLALGGVIGAMAVLTKQELLLPVVGGLFVLEAGSVLIQVASYKTRGKRVFRMAPLHHHFELKGWSESKVIVRFWILALLFALASLSALKLR